MPRLEMRRVLWQTNSFASAGRPGVQSSEFRSGAHPKDASTNDMAAPIVFFSSSVFRQALQPALESMFGIAELRWSQDAEESVAEAAILVASGAVDAKLFAGRALIAVMYPEEPAAADLMMASEAGVLLVRASPGTAMVGQLRDLLAGRVPDGALNPDRASRLRRLLPALAPETGGTAGPEPTRYGDWQHKGRVTDF